VVGLGVGNTVSLPGLLVGREFSRAQFASVVSLVTVTNQETPRGSYGYGAALALCLGLDAMAAAWS
jgi:hypothetical protein